MQDQEILDLFFARDEQAIAVCERQFGPDCKRLSMGILQIQRADPRPAGLGQPFRHRDREAPTLHRRGQGWAIGTFPQRDGEAEAREAVGGKLQIGYAVGCPCVPRGLGGGEELFGQMGGYGQSGKGLGHENESRRQMLHGGIQSSLV